MEIRCKSILTGILLCQVCAVPVSAADAGAPAAPGRIEAAPDSDGLLKVEVTLQAPEKTVAGETLVAIDEMRLFRDGQEIRTFSGVTPGATYSFTDTSVENGYAVYSAQAFIGTTAGETATTEPVYIGVDVPLPPSGVKVSDKDDRLIFTWQKSGRTGANGERVRPDGVTFVVEVLDASYEVKSLVAETKGQTAVYYFPTTLGAQDVLRFGVRAYNAAGRSEYTYLRTVTGAPYNFPYAESFATGVLHGMSWQEGDGTFTPVTSESCDGDAGALMCEPDAAGGNTSFNLGKILMSHARNPRLSFMTKGLASGETAEVRVARPDGAEASLLKINGPLADWTEFGVDLSAVKAVKYIIPKFRLTAGNTATVYIDDIRIEDPYDTDLSVMLDAPESSAGATEIYVTLTNCGLQPASEAAVLLYADGRLVDTLKTEKELQPGESVTLTAGVEVEGDDYVEIMATVQWPFDLNAANDTATAYILPDDNAKKDAAAGVDTLGITGEENAGVIYTIDGKRLDTAPGQLPPGIYIINGCKVIIK